jgi:transporter family-2 protein
MGGTGVAVIVALVAGLLGSVQVALMGRFGERIGTIEAFAFSAAVTALIAGFVLLAARRSLAGYGEALTVPKWLWLAGACGAFIVLAVTVAGPRIGVAATVALLIAGQLAAGAVIDRFGLFGAEKVPLAWHRVLGIALLAIGAALSLRK